MHALFLMSVWLHIVAAVAWIGGALFLTIVFVPALRDPAMRDGGLALLHRAARRFLWVAWICFAVLIVTGAFNLLMRVGMDPAILAGREFWTGAYGGTLAWKLLVFGVILVLSALHDFVLGPLASKASTGRVRAAVRWMGRVNLLLGLLVIALAVGLVRGWPAS